MKFKRGVIAVAAVAGLMLAGSGAASAQPLSSESAVPEVSLMDLVFTFFFGPNWPPLYGCGVLGSPCPPPAGSSLSDFGSS